MTKNFETMMSELEQIVAKLDQEQVSLDDAIKLYERGITLSQNCQKQLKEAEEKINKVQMDSDNE